MEAGRIGRFQKCLLVDSRARDHCSFYPPDQRKLDLYVSLSVRIAQDNRALKRRSEKVYEKLR